MDTVTQTTIDRNSIGVHIFGIGLSLKVTGIKKAFGLAKNGVHKGATKLAAKTADAEE